LEATELGSVAGGAELEMAKKETLELVVSAMADSLRCKILSTVAEVAFETPGGGNKCLGNGITIRGLAERTGEPARRVRYHLDALCEQGLVEVTDGKARRGVVERYFAPARLPILDEEDVAALSPATQKRILLSCLKMIFSDVTASLEAGAAVRRPDWAVGRVPGEVDEQGRQQLATLHTDFITKTKEVIEQAQERLAETEEPPVRVISATLFFEAASPEEPVA
jgi:DNA-binding transcriptional ArsR family regulator